jgi:H+/Cl- antiporter ClcA
VAKPASAAIAIGTGGPFGAEGPIIVTGGALGSLIGQALTVSAAERKILLAAGAAAGMAATFGVPLAAVVLAIELLVFEFSTRAIVPLLASTSVATGMHVVFFGPDPLFEVPTHQFFGLGNAPAFAVLGVACGLLAVVVCRGLFLVEGGFRRLPVPPFWHPVIGALGFGLVGLVVPGALGVGYDEIGDVLLDRMAMETMAALLVAKLLAWWIALGSGTSGGTLAPVLLISGCFGSLFASGIDRLAPGLEVSSSAFALVAMAATFAAATRTPLTSIVFVFELTRDYDAVLPLMGTTLIAVLIARRLMDDSLMTEKLSRRGLAVHGDYEVDRTRTMLVRDVMTEDVAALSVDGSEVEVRDTILERPHSMYPLLDSEHRARGIISRHDAATLAGRAGSFGHALESHPTIRAAEAVVVTPAESVYDVRSRLLDAGADLAVVQADGRIVGVCTRTDILKPRLAQLEQERPSPGWTTQLRERHLRSSPS